MTRASKGTKTDRKMTSIECEVAIGDLKPHPKNYKKHPADQLEHLRASLKQYGFFRRVVVAKDNTILAGHGLVEAAKGMEFKMVPAQRFALEPDDPRALKLVAIDNEVGRFGEVDDRALTELLKGLSGDLDIGGLLGTGFDEQMLGAMVFATRMPNEFGTKDAAAEWAGAGMPEYDSWEGKLRIVVLVRTEEDRKKLMQKLLEGIDPKSYMVRMGKSATWSTWWPPKKMNTSAALEFVEEETAKR